MANHDPIATADRWLTSVLSSDAELAQVAPGGVFEDLADSGTVSPFVVVTVYDSKAFRTFGHEDLWTVFVHVTATGVGENASTQSLSPVVSRVYELLDGATPAPIPGGGRLSSCTRIDQVPAFTAGTSRKRESVGAYKILLTL